MNPVNRLLGEFRRGDWAGGTMGGAHIDRDAREELIALGPLQGADDSPAAEVLFVAGNRLSEGTLRQVIKAAAVDAKLPALESQLLQHYGL